MVRAVLAIGVLALGGCVRVVAFSCEEDAQCDRLEGGRCFEGGCAAPDPGCESGYRYGDDASSSNACVEPLGSSSSASTSDGSSGGGSSTSEVSSSSSTTGGPSESSSSTSAADTSSSGGASSSSSSSSGSTGTTGCLPDDCTCVEQLEVGNQFNCVLRDDGAVACWGRNNWGQAGVADPELETISQPRLVDLGGNVAVEVAAHFEHACARIDDGTVWCWGRSLDGIVDPTTAEDGMLDPQPVPGVEDVTALRLGLRSSCARHADDTLTCWGRDTFALLLTDEVGNGPVTTGPYPGLVDFSVGLSHGCMWTDQEVSCWGRNNWGQVASPMPGQVFSEPQQVSLPGAPVWVGVGRNHTCAALEGGDIWCWGYNQHNQVTGGDMSEGVPDPTLLDAPWDGGVVRLFAQGYNTCVETDTPELWCWGGTQGGWLGAAELANNVPLWPPRRLEPYAELEAGTVDIGAGINHVCTTLETAEVYCWGNSSYWQVGPSAPKIGEETVRVDPCAAM